MKNEKFIKMLPLETERLIIRKTSVDDVDLMLKMDKQEITQKFLGGVKDKTREERIELLERKSKKFDDGIAGSLTVCLKDGTPIGITGLSIDEGNNIGKIGYLFDVDYTNKGYCTEVCRKLVDIGFKDLELNKIWADTVRGNDSSKRVLEKLNFTLEATRREAAYDKITHEYRDFLEYGILRSEYDN